MDFATWSSWPGMASWIDIHESISILFVDPALVSCCIAFCCVPAEVPPARSASLNASALSLACVSEAEDGASCWTADAMSSRRVGSAERRSDSPETVAADSSAE